MNLRHCLIVLAVAFFVKCDEQNTNKTEGHSPAENFKKSREISFASVISCAVKYDVSCLVDAAEDYLEARRTELLVQADTEALRATGRSDPDSRPSHLADVIGKLISELTSIFQNGVSGFFKSAREADDDEDNLTETQDGTSDTNGEARGKKKKKKRKLVGLLKLFGIGAVIYKKVCLLLKLFNAALQFKFYLIALGGLLLHAAKFWISLKKDHHPQKVIYYEHAQHQHHYGHEDEGHSLWGRAFKEDNRVNVTLPDLAYYESKPYNIYVAVTDKIF